MNDSEIDALVAEKVFGWKKDAVHPNLRGSGWWEDRPGSYTCEIPEFSTDPAASKQLRDKMRSDGWTFKLLVSVDGSACAAFNHATRDRGHADAEEEMRAVAYAALDAYRVEVEDV